MDPEAPKDGQVHETNHTGSQATSRRSHWFVWIMPAIPFLYVLSIGPAIYVLPPSVLHPLYGPLIRLESHCKPLDRFLTWYMQDVWKCGLW